METLKIFDASHEDITDKVIDPATHPVFVPGKESGLEDLEQGLRDALVILDNYKNAKGITKAKVGSGFASHMARLLGSLAWTKEQKDMVRLFWNEVEKRVGDSQLWALKSGIFSDILSRKEFSGLGLVVRESTRQEDVGNEKTDYWIELDEDLLTDPEEGERLMKNLLMVQVKSLGIKENNRDVPVLIPLQVGDVHYFAGKEKREEIRHYAKRVGDKVFDVSKWEGVDPQDTERFNQFLDKKYKFIEMIEKMVTESSRYNNVGAAVVVLPSFTRESSKVNEVTGEQIVQPGEKRIRVDFQKILRNAYVNKEY